MIICEIGLNHLGEQSYAEQYLSALIDGRPDAVTFQVREPIYYTGSETALKLSDEFYAEAVKNVHSSALKFGVALADAEKIAFFESLGVDFYKVLSKDLFNSSLTDKLFATGKTIFCSTGMSDFEEVRTFAESLAQNKRNCRLIHTQLTYELQETQLKAIETMRALVSLPVAFGSHARNFHVLYAAAALEPSDILFYVRGGRTTKHPDEDHAVLLKQVPEVIANLREIASMIGTGQKRKMENMINSSP